VRFLNLDNEGALAHWGAVATETKVIYKRNDFMIKHILRSSDSPNFDVMFDKLMAVQSVILPIKNCMAKEISKK
jgi:hypothetical protein